ncbi:RimK-like protein [Xenococcus sp. PCC 7305]|uniref:MvdC family ATP-grasp ribosomal peptide maturase n=1 Tax=Xenococcus sp. PCC 7305 TaxID=102125 RepID=UPI0002ACF056|nr:MvdC family ATP-grasp ribosomal peptide maturase [Xenococcus sp. PCC 7305]ELS03782.1 RimK-like protein [Xenococcus sp. PCC 7305]
MSSSQDIVLLLTHSGDYFTVDKVAQALSKRGASPFRLDTDLFPLEVQLSARLSNSGLKHQIRYGDRSISTEQVKAVWMRRLWEPKMNPQMEPHLQSGSIRESRAALDGFLDSLHKLRWVDALPRIREAENKLLQLRIAAEVGLTIPQTLVTNDPTEARQFFQELEGSMAAKLLTPLSYSMGKSSLFMYTSAVQEQDLAEAETLRYCPMVFQEKIPKLCELRVIYVAGELFVGALEASRYDGKTLDWRNISPEDCPWESHQITEEIFGQLNSLMTRLGLTYGAIDLIQKPNGEYIFLEVNPTGEWGMLERDLNLPISDAIAKALLN